VRLPLRLWHAIRAADLLVRDAACVVGFGGYVSMPAYLAARRRGVPIVVHEQNARAGIANRIGARWAAACASTFAESGLARARVIGLPLRSHIAEVAAALEHDRHAVRGRSRAALALPDQARVLLVTGGSQGSARINAAVAQALPDLLADGWVILHAVGERNLLPAAVPGYHPLPYIDRMDLALSASDLLIGRAGAGTCAEAAAVALPAIFVPLPIGNGEQALNARDSVAAGGALLVADSDCDGPGLVAAVRQCAERLDDMRATLRGSVHLTAAASLAQIIDSIVMGGAGR
jgi:UDP-N-acetylglucosamine:LPS N-acetylglucosamine transferase